MKFESLLEIVGDQPLIESTTLRAFGEEPGKLSVQLSRWVAAGRLIQLRRGVYLLAKPYRRHEAAKEFIANLLLRPSYVSCECALAIHGLIPEEVTLVQSVTTGRTTQFPTSIGDFQYRHIKTNRFFGYGETAVAHGRALVAVPEKALLDTVYFSKGEFTNKRIEEIRLQDLDRLDLNRLTEFADRLESPRLTRAARKLAEWIGAERRAEVWL